MGKVELDYENSAVLFNGKKISDLYEPQSLQNVLSRGIAIASGHEEQLVIDTNTGEVISRKFTR